MKVFLIVFRPLNLAMMLILMLSVHFFLLKPIFSAYGLEMVLDDFHHFLLAISCALIASGVILLTISMIMRRLLQQTKTAGCD